jgi:hypothetical protein
MLWISRIIPRLIFFMRFSRALNIMFCILLFACAPGKHLYVYHDSTLIKIDSTHLRFYGDSSSRDTVRYSKQYVYHERTPKTVSGKWYLISAIIILITLVLIKK